MTDNKKENNEQLEEIDEVEEEVIVSEEIEDASKENTPEEDTTTSGSESSENSPENDEDSADESNPDENANDPIPAKEAAEIIESNTAISAKEAAKIIEDNEDSAEDIAEIDEYKETFVSSKERKKAEKAEKRKAKGSKSFNGLILAFAILAFICSGTTLTLYLTGALNRINWTTFDQGNTASFTNGTIAEVANRVSPSVVSILTETRIQSWYGQSSTSSAAGTGVIVTKDGYVLTNKHVIEGANKVSVVLDNGTTYEPSQVEIIGTDPSNDIAFLKIKDVTDLNAASLGDSKNITIGQQVIAIGNALGMYQNTVTEGIISGTGRTIDAADSTGQNVERLTDMLQTDAAINAGNSGGPLVNAAGQVIGINTAVGSGNNLGFAIPISSIKGMLKTLIETGKLQRSYIGVYYESLTPQTAKQNNLDVSAGAYIHSTSGSAVITDSPAAKAGLKDGDIIIRVNGAKVGSAGSLGTLIGEYAPGDKITLTIIRDKEEKTLDLTLGSYPTQNQQKS
ncbi:trypsin-like peptidase domain-containing protein [Candidatus Saccharibacteria bacterium]|nr:trypsin-like peptidase domain-containing protein [Candidatus Saccharibacteria bacterium]